MGVITEYSFELGLSFKLVLIPYVLTAQLNCSFSTCVVHTANQRIPISLSVSDVKNYCVVVHALADAE